MEAINLTSVDELIQTDPERDTYMMVHSSMASRNETYQPARPLLSFSIERILHGHFKTERERLNRKRVVSTAQRKVQRVERSAGKLVENFIQKFDWLEYTRYNPPKLPKSSKRRQKTKRKPGRNPRVPFTPKQLATLESKFQTMKYLTSDDVNALCAELNLEEQKIKIWFQNRRAREKRKTTQEEYIDVTTVDIECNNDR